MSLNAKKSEHIKLITTVMAVTVLSITPLQGFASLNYPPYRTDYELHGEELYGQRSVVEVITPDLSTDNPQWWADSYVVEMNIVSDNSNGAVGSGYAYFEDGGTINSRAVKILLGQHSGQTRIRIFFYFEFHIV